MPYQIPQGIEQYLINLYQRFDKEPDGVPVLRIEDRGAGGYYQNGHLRIQNFHLSLVPGSQTVVNGGVESIAYSPSRSVEIDLLSPSQRSVPYLKNNILITPTITIEEVYDIILGAGYETSKVEPRFFSVAASILAETDETYDGRSFLSVATSVLWRVLMPIAIESYKEKQQANFASRQFDLHLAEGKWLDRIGLLYGLRRYEKEQDERFRRRIDYHVARPHANNTALEYMIQRLFSAESTIHDGSKPEWFLTDDEASVTYSKGLRNIHRTPPGQVPFFSVNVDILYADEAETPDVKLDREMGKNQWFYTDSSTSTTAAFGQDSQANTTPPNNRYYGTILENREMLLLPTEAEREVYRSLLQYKASGTRFILSHRHTLTLDDTQLVEPFTLFVEQTSISDPIVKNRVVENTNPPVRTFLTTDDLYQSPSSVFVERTVLLAAPLVNGTPVTITKILSDN